jgi:hypothetical protein
MSAREREIRLRIVATDTHCAGCRCASGAMETCGAFGKTPKVDEWGNYLRLPECIAAEGAGQKGGDK